jgi:hypothetical protein
MANTTNFNWETPDDTDLVKDGAAAMRTLGNSIDTSFVDLKGGTTGQVLSKASNTDLDYTWVTTDDANAIQNAIVDAKGDLIAASANDTPARLAVGANGETLVADSSTSTGLRYTAGTVQSNPVLNSAFQIWQRGTSISQTASTNTYTADRWQALNGANQANTISRQATGDTTNLPNIQYNARFQRNSGQTGTSDTGLFQSWESVNVVPFAGKTVTVSFYARKGANYSATSDLLKARVYSGTGTDGNILNGFAGSSTFIDQSPVLTTTWQRFSYSGFVQSGAREFAIGLYYQPTGTAGANDYFEITGIQVDIGSVALPFRTYAGTIQGELAACQRYYQKIASGNNSPIGYGSFLSATLYEVGVHFPVEMRANPTIDATTGTSYYTTNSIVQNLNSLLIDQTTTRFVVLYNNTNVAGATSGDSTWVRGNNASTYLALSAEL